MRAVGGGLLLYLAFAALRQWRHPDNGDGDGSAPCTLRDAVLVNLLNPNPYLGWALVLGPSALAAWREDPAYAVALVATYYGTMVALLALFILLAGTVRFLNPRAQRGLMAASALALAGLGLYMVIAGVRGVAAA